MALQVWLPLNGNSNNQGLTNWQFTNNNATVDNSGKIGKCYAFSGSSQYLRLNQKVIDTSQFTISFWMYATDVSANHCIFSTRNVTSGAVNIYLLSAGIRFDTSTTANWQTGFKPSANTWYHITLVQDATTKYLYVNGVLNTSTAGTTDLTQVSSVCTIGCEHINGSSIGTYFAGKLNDFRIYSHALAPKEIEILSRGLVCHYPLNGGGRGGDNICTWGYSQSPHIPNAAGTTKLSETDYGDYRRYTCTTVGTTGGRYAYPVGQSGVLAQGNVYTWSAEFRANKQLSFTSLSCIGMEGGGVLAGSDIKIDTEWRRLSKTWTQTSSQALILYPKDSMAVNDWIDIRNFKIEVGNTATPWMPNPADSAYTAMGYNSTTEYDVSGYGNNMTKTGTITYTSDSARYSVASHFINGSYILATKNCPDYLPTDSVTVNLWIKPTTWANPISCTESGGWNFEGSTIQFVCYISGVGYKAAVSGVTGASLQDGKWHMLTGTYDRIAQEVKIYVDGILKTTTATGSSNNIGYASNRLVISGEAGGGTPASSAFVGEESDVRIYATALSATQVAELYNTAVSVANNGTLMGYELVEV